MEAVFDVTGYDLHAGGYLVGESYILKVGADRRDGSGPDFRFHVTGSDKSEVKKGALFLGKLPPAFQTYIFDADGSAIETADPTNPLELVDDLTDIRALEQYKMGNLSLVVPFSTTSDGKLNLIPRVLAKTDINNLFELGAHASYNTATETLTFGPGLYKGNSGIEADIDDKGDWSIFGRFGFEFGK